MPVRVNNSRPLRVIFAVPALLALVTAIGLVSALLGDGIWDLASWMLLGIPVAFAIWYMKLRRTR
jgi:hypothetical protein